VAVKHGAAPEGLSTPKAGPLLPTSGGAAGGASPDSPAGAEADVDANIPPGDDALVAAFVGDRCAGAAWLAEVDAVAASGDSLAILKTLGGLRTSRAARTLGAQEATAAAARLWRAALATAAAVTDARSAAAAAAAVAAAARSWENVEMKERADADAGARLDALKLELRRTIRIEADAATAAAEAAAAEAAAARLRLAETAAAAAAA
jgi:hypothetical protein